MKQLSSFMVLNVNGGDRISFTFDEINETNGEPIRQNEKRSFYAVDTTLQKHIKAIRDYIKSNKLEG